MVEVQQLNLCTIEIHPCYLPRHKNLLLTFDLLGLSKTIIPFFHWALQLNIQTNASFPLLPQSRVQKRTQEDVGVYRGKKYLCKKLGVKEGEGCVFWGGGGGGVGFRKLNLFSL